MNKKVLIGISVVAVIIAIIAANISQNSVPSFSTGRVFDVSVKAVERGEISSVVTASGVVEATETEKIYFNEPVKVEEILVKKNQEVVRGQKLVEIDISYLYSELEQLKIDQHVQELAISKIKIADSTIGITSLKSAVDLADKRVENLKESLDEALRNYENSKELFAADAISRSDFEKAESLKREAEFALKDAEQNKKTAEESLVEAQKSNSESERSKGIELQISEKSLEATKLKIAELEKKIKNVTNSTVSSIDGIVTEINIEQGGYANTAIPGFSIINPNKLKVTADVKEFYVKDIAAGQKVIITGDAISEDDNITGIVDGISPVAKKKSGSTGEETLLEVVISIQEGNSILKPGLTVNSKIITNVKQDALIVTFDMLKEDENGNKQVFVVDKNNKMHETPVKLGITSELDAEVVDGLNEGDMVVLYPMPNFTDGARARLIKD